MRLTTATLVALSALCLVVPWVLLLAAASAAPHLSSLGMTADSYGILVGRFLRLSFYVLVLASGLAAFLRATRFKLLAVLAVAGIAACLWFLNARLLAAA